MTSPPVVDGATLNPVATTGSSNATHHRQTQQGHGSERGDHPLLRAHRAAGGTVAHRIRLSHFQRAGRRAAAFHQAWAGAGVFPRRDRSEEHTSELQSLMRISYA